MNSRRIAKVIAFLLSTKKGKEIVILDVRKITFLTDYFLFASATSNVHLRTLRETLEEDPRKSKLLPLRSEGTSTSSWQVLDYGGVIVHLFLPEVRNFYQLEKFWGEAKIVPWQMRITADKKRRLPRIKKRIKNSC